MDKQITKEYTNGQITIVWKPALCVHSRICWGKANSLPEVFNPKERPWIKPEASNTDRIIEQINQCPSGALSFYVNQENKIADLTQNEEVTHETIVEPLLNGPLLIHGNIMVKDKDGIETKKRNSTAFCRCGGSYNKPFCDGTHVILNFTG